MKDILYPRRPDGTPTLRSQPTPLMQDGQPLPIDQAQEVRIRATGWRAATAARTQPKPRG